MGPRSPPSPSHSEPDWGDDAPDSGEQRAERRDVPAEPEEEPVEDDASGPAAWSLTGKPKRRKLESQVRWQKFDDTVMARIAKDIRRAVDCASRVEVHEADFSKGRLTSLAAVADLCSMLPNLHILKLYSNHLADDSAPMFGRIFRACPLLVELHLSHNGFTLRGVEDIANSANTYLAPNPRRPLWMRMESNKIKFDLARFRELEGNHHVCSAADSSSCDRSRCEHGKRIHMPIVLVEDKQQHRHHVDGDGVSWADARDWQGTYWQNSGWSASYHERQWDRLDDDARQWKRPDRTWHGWTSWTEDSAGRRGWPEERQRATWRGAERQRSPGRGAERQSSEGWCAQRGGAWEEGRRGAEDGEDEAGGWRWHEWKQEDVARCVVKCEQDDEEGDDQAVAAHGHDGAPRRRRRGSPGRSGGRAENDAARRPRASTSSSASSRRARPAWRSSSPGSRPARRARRDTAEPLDAVETKIAMLLRDCGDDELRRAFDDANCFLSRMREKGSQGRRRERRPASGAVEQPCVAGARAADGPPERRQIAHVGCAASPQRKRTRRAAATGLPARRRRDGEGAGRQGSAGEFPGAASAHESPSSSESESEDSRHSGSTSSSTSSSSSTIPGNSAAGESQATSECSGCSSDGRCSQFGRVTVP